MRLGLGVKRFLVQVAIASAKAGAFLLGLMAGVGRALVYVGGPVWRAAVHYVGVPIYRLFFHLRRLLPAISTAPTSPFMARHSWVSRFIPAWCIGASILLVTSVNLSQADALRSADIGQKSPLYTFFTGEQALTYTVRAAPATVRPTRYLAETFFALPEADTHSPDDSYTAITTEGGVFIAPTISGTAESVAPRSEIVTYLVKSGDVLGAISEKYGLSLSTILWANNLTARSTLRPGMELTILPTDGVIHKVKKGETAAAIAKKYKVETEKVLAFNGLDNKALSVGQSLIIPGGTPPVIVPVAPARSLANVFSTPPAGTKGTGASASGRMLWPTDLHIITQRFGWKHTGIDVDCHFTNNNYAADNGTVQYSGWKNGYGNVVEINHGNGIITRYGHHAKLYVKAGQPIAKGTPIGLCGTTGKSTGTHLHFEVIVGGKFRNPLEYVR